MNLRLFIFPLVFVVSLCIVIWMIVPTYKEAKKIRDVDLANAKQELAREQEINKNIDMLKSDYLQYEDDLSTLEYAVPEDEDIKSFLIQVETIILENGLTYDRIAPESGDIFAPREELNIGFKASQTALGKETNPRPIPVVVEMLGEYENIVKAFSELEKLNRVNNIVSVEIKRDNENKPQEEGANNIMKASIIVEIYQQEPIDPVLLRRIFESAQQQAQDAAASGDGSASSNTTQEAISN